MTVGDMVQALLSVMAGRDFHPVWYVDQESRKGELLPPPVGEWWEQARQGSEFDHFLRILARDPFKPYINREPYAWDAAAYVVGIKHRARFVELFGEEWIPREDWKGDQRREFHTRASEVLATLGIKAPD
jgi:hypothetical protein